MDKFLILLCLLGIGCPVQQRDDQIDAAFDAAYCCMLAVGLPYDCYGTWEAHYRFLTREQLDGYEQEFWWVDRRDISFLRGLYFESKALPRLEEAIPFGYQSNEYLAHLRESRDVLGPWHDAGYATRYLEHCYHIALLEALISFQSQHGWSYQRRLSGAWLCDAIGRENFMKGYLP